MEFIKTAEMRASVRSFTDEPVPAGKLMEMARIAGTAPCIGGKETWSFVAVTNKELIEKMASAVKAKYDATLAGSDSREAANVRAVVETFSTVFEKAPAVIAVLAEPYHAVVDKALDKTGISHSDMNRMRNYPDMQTIGACIENLLLAAVDMGYGACWQTGPMVAKEELSKLLDVKEPYSLIAMVAVGKPDKPVTPRIKKPVEEIFRLIQ